MVPVYKKRFFRIGVAAALAAIAAVLAAIWAAQVLPGALRSDAMAADGEEGNAGGDSAIAVLTVRPRSDPSFAMRVEVDPADVKPYYETDIEAHVPGPIEFIRKARGSRVKAGETLVKIAVPDLEQELELKKEIVNQKKQEQKLAEANVQIAEAAVALAATDIKLRDIEVKTADATSDYRHRELARLTQLAGGRDPAVTPDVIDERKSVAIAAADDSQSARQAVEKAKAKLQEMKAKSAAARADVELKKALVKVAAKDRDLAQATVDFATIKAPYDGVITRRNVDPGSFVRSATSGRTEPLLTLQRTDIVTVWVKLPDVYAPYVTTDSDTVIEMSELPGHLIHGKITRFNPSLLTQEHDRTMRVEVDLHNGTEKEYQDFLAKERQKKEPFDDLKEGPLPLFPRVEGKHDAADSIHLLPGMYGKMTLVLRKFKDAYLIPSSAIVRQAGVPYVYLVKDGVAHLQQVGVQVNDEKLAKVVLVETVGGDTLTRRLTGKEEIVYSNQGELNDGTAVKTNEVDWAQQ
jgi:multidrug resistance efflux pump